MALRVRPIPTWFPINILCTSLENIPLHFIPSVWRPRNDVGGVDFKVNNHKFSWSRRASSCFPHTANVLFKWLILASRFRHCDKASGVVISAPQCLECRTDISYLLLLREIRKGLNSFRFYFILSKWIVLGQQALLKWQWHLRHDCAVCYFVLFANISNWE